MDARFAKSKTIVSFTGYRACYPRFLHNYNNIYNYVTIDPRLTLDPERVIADGSCAGENRDESNPNFRHSPIGEIV
jgi:hypothetical protein